MMGTQLAQWTPERPLQAVLSEVADELGMFAGALTTVLPEWNDEE